MISFKKYPSIENHYQTKFIQEFLLTIKGLANQRYIAREKLDGVSFQLIFQPYQNMLIANKDELLEGDAEFYDIQDILKRYEHLIDFYQFQTDRVECDIILYGEIYGNGVKKSIYYGKEKYISIFDIMIDDQFVPQNIIKFVLKNIGFQDLLPKSFGIFSSLKRALNVKIPNNIEGVIIQPYTRVIIDNKGDRFILKKKAT